MFIRIDEIQLEHATRSRHKSKRVIVCLCDVCGQEFSKKYTKPEHKRTLQKLSFCSRTCMNESRKLGGLLMRQTQSNRDNAAWSQKVQATLNERYGVTNPGQLPNHIEKCAQTLMITHNVTCALNIPYARKRMIESLESEDVQQARRSTNIKRYGHENVFGSQQIQDKIKQTLQERYGVEHSSQIEGVAEKKKEICRQRFGYDAAIQTPKARDKSKQTMIERYGTPTFWQSESFKTLAKTPEYSQQRHETMKLNGTYRKSNPEDALYDALLMQFPSTQRQVITNGWAIDFYIPEIDTYIQLDGVYWHGLDRPREMIETSTLPRDGNILSTMNRDIRQNEWFKSQNKRLLRFTDKQSIDEIFIQLKQ